MVKRFGTASLAMVLPLLLASAALGQAQDPREMQARKDCLKGNYTSGTALLADLFAETSNENFIYNQARCYEQNGRPDEAIQRFREYLRVACNIAADDKADVEHHIAECRAMKAEQEQAVAPSVGATVAPPTAELTPAPASPTIIQPDGTEQGRLSPAAPSAATATGVISPQGGGFWPDIQGGAIVTECPTGQYATNTPERVTRLGTDGVPMWTWMIADRSAGYIYSAVSVEGRAVVVLAQAKVFGLPP
jgi:hypothetical protein